MTIISTCPRYRLNSTGRPSFALTVKLSAGGFPPEGSEIADPMTARPMTRVRAREPGCMRTLLSPMSDAAATKDPL
ncbi:MAG: hypothetical protein K6T35_14360, partial [Meiothermus silvanus]|nr:hypothetical protein [Allomeiothermus silvanus]